jgi:hypothetical protein
MVIDVGFSLPDKSPLQLLNIQPFTGVVVSCTDEPGKYETWSGVLDTEPEPATFMVNV